MWSWRSNNHKFGKVLGLKSGKRTMERSWISLKIRTRSFWSLLTRKQSRIKEGHVGSDEREIIFDIKMLIKKIK